MQTIGPVLTGNGARFTVFADGASRVDLCLFDAARGEPEQRRIPMDAIGGGIWAAECGGVRAGQLYGFRADGPFDPPSGQWFNPNMLLLDPYARAVTPSYLMPQLYGYESQAAPRDVKRNTRDSAPAAPKSIVVDPRFDWKDDRPPRTAWKDTVIYECHVKGLTARHPRIQPEARGSFAGACAPPIIEHLHRLGVTAVEFLPVPFSMTRQWLSSSALCNYWGYDGVCFFAPDPRYGSGGDGREVREFKEMVRSLHQAGIEVILDMVFNHTVEGDESGPTICMRGLSHTTYYRLAQGRCVDWTGCGNTLNTDHPIVRRLIVDCLRYWVDVMHIDGFRLDLAAALGRHEGGFVATHALWIDILSDPVLAGVKWIAEPWDATAEGYALGRFPRPFAEWNDRYRDNVRRFWRGDARSGAGLAFALTGSSDVFAPDRVPLSSVHYAACHDGFTLRDLVSFEHKHNEANAEQNRDGSSHNLSRNWGAEGETSQWRVLRMRERAQRNFLATVATSLGVPMLTSGDELNHSQRGNNNAYCQDNDISWLDWPATDAPPDAAARMREFAAHVLALRREHSALRQERALRGEVLCTCGMADVAWLTPQGRPMTPEDWHDPARQALAMLRHAHGDPSDTLLLLVNGSSSVVPFQLPSLPTPGHWRRRINTLVSTTAARDVTRGVIKAAAFSLILLDYQ